MDNIGINGIDFLLVFVFIILAHVMLKLLYKNNYENHSLFFKALFLKYGFSILLCLITVYLYGGIADSTGYFKESIGGRRAVSLGDFSFFQYLNLSEQEFLDYGWVDHGSDSGIFLVKLGFLFSFPGCKSYLLTSLIFAFASYFGIWKFYTTALKIFPNKAKLLQIGILFLPSVGLYSSGIFKDTLSFSALGWVVYCLYEFNQGSIRNLKKWLIFIVSLYVIYIVRSYVFYSILVSLIFMIYIRVGNTILKASSKFFFHFFFITAIAITVVNFYSDIERELTATFLDEVVKNKVFYDAIGGGSNYNIISSESFTLIDLIKVLPLSIFTTLFRPFLWESSSALMLFSSIENTFLFILFIYSLFKYKLSNFIYNMRNNGLLPFSIFFVLAFAGLVSIYTSNFGTLTRYRISAMPLLVFIIINIQSRGVFKSKRANNQKANQTGSIEISK